MIKNRPSEVIPQLKIIKKTAKKTTFAYVNKQPRLQIFPNRKKEYQNKQTKESIQRLKAGVCSKVAITYRLGFWTSKGENKAQAQRKNRNYLVTKVYYMFNTKKVWRKMYLY